MDQYSPPSGRLSCRIAGHDPHETKPALPDRIRACRLCSERFAATATRHLPRPVVWFRPGARLAIISQAPGARAHASGRPFTDRSGQRLREWMALDEARFYDQDRVAIVPMAFCFPGYDAAGNDLPPPPICAQTWRAEIDAILSPRLTLLIGGHAIFRYLGRRKVTETVAAWRDFGPGLIPLPHPSWRNTAWLARNPWFSHSLLPDLRKAVRQALAS